MDRGAWLAAVHGVARVGHDFTFTFTFHFHVLEKEMATHSSVLAWRIQGQQSLVGYCLWGCTESDTTEVKLAAAAAGEPAFLLNKYSYTAYSMPGTALSNV